MTERLYYTDPYTREFDATVEAVDERDGRLIVTLDRTGFYPTSGGQPFDTGALGPFNVVDVVDDEDGTVVHVVEGPRGPVLRAGETVRGTIDWRRRFDHMQQHTGQHVLSAACDRVCGVRTVSFHLGAGVSTIDLARELTARDIDAAEAEANRIVWEDRPVTIRFASAEEAAQLPLRKESRREGRLRLVEVEGFDLSACGGTHVARTGAIGMIAVTSWERFKGGQRLEFVCGGRALERFRSLRDTVATAVRLLSATPEELRGSIERLQAEVKEQRRTIVALQGQVARYSADELAAAGEETRVGRIVLRAIDSDANGLKALASAVTEHPGIAAVLVSTSSPALIVIARSPDLVVKANEVLAALIATFGGRGGGRPELAQGGGLNASPEAILSGAREMLVR